MISCIKNKFWLENPVQLFCSYELIPLNSMTLQEQMNALTRLVFFVSLILFLLGFKQTILFLLILLVFIIIVYYIQMKTAVENYTKPHIIGSKPVMDLWKNINNSNRFCDDAVELDGPNGVFNNRKWTSPSQKLAGSVNPKTLIPPVITPPSHDLGYWRANNLINHSAINDVTNIDVYQSGYQVSTCCAPIYDCRETCKLAIPLQQTPMIEEGYCGSKYPELGFKNSNNERTGSRGGPLQQTPIIEEGYCGSKYPELGFKNSNNGLTGSGGCTKNFIQENFEIPFFKNNIDKMNNPYTDTGQINTQCGYNPSQLEIAGLPTNLPAGNCSQLPSMKEYNTNLFTQTIQPGVYTTNQINQPINSNIGISFTQQFNPTTCKTNMWSGQVNYTQHDPNIIEPLYTPPEAPTINESNVYDPRFSGYGTSYRAYTDNNIGQTRFYYDDVDAIRMPNYIVRSNIDFAPFADSYGPIPGGDEFGNKNNPDIRALANDAFLQAAITQRTSLQESLMRKRNSEMWQLRKAPRGGQQRMMGGLGGC